MMSNQSAHTATPQLYRAHRWNLLLDSLFTVEREDGSREILNLCAALAKMSHGQWTEFAMVQAQQQHPWHAFLVQLAAAALFRGDQESAKGVDELQWRALLRALTNNDDAPWCLCVSDLSKAAFMQPPVPEGSLEVLKETHEEPAQDLDLLITAKQHDVKRSRGRHASPEQWIFTLLTLQTMQGFLGAGNYGIARMNGGFGSRAALGVAAQCVEHSRWLRDVEVALEWRRSLMDGAPNHDGFLLEDGALLLWTLPWTGQSSESLSIGQLDPLFIEVCRRVRLVAQGSPDEPLIVAHRGTTAASRIAAKERFGNVGDLWLPVMKTAADGEFAKAFTASDEGFSYRRLHDLLLSDDWQHPLSQLVRPDDGPSPTLIAQVFVRGQGKTGGYHERWLVLPAAVKKALGQKDRVALLRERGKRWIDTVKNAELKVLKPALLTVLSDTDPNKLDISKDSLRAIIAQVSAAVDQFFFQVLFSTMDQREEDASYAFEYELLKLVGRVFEEGCAKAPVPSARKYRAQARGRSRFEAGLYTHFRSYMDRQKAEKDAANKAAPNVDVAPQQEVLS